MAIRRHHHHRELASCHASSTVVLTIILIVGLIIFLRKDDVESVQPKGAAPSRSASCGRRHNGPAVASQYYEERLQVYNRMAREAEVSGAKFMEGGNTSQSLKINDIFIIRDGIITPILKKAIPPVRANVLYMDPRIGSHLMRHVRHSLAPRFNSGSIWYQDENMVHISLVHASHHISPVVANSSQVDAEAAAVFHLAQNTCPLLISLDRILLTSTGVLLGCWQLLDGTEPSELRSSLRTVLPNSPSKQLYNQFMLHTSFARVLGPPLMPPGENSVVAIQKVLDEIVQELNRKLCALQAIVRELWYVEEFDLLALALKGNIRERRFLLTCRKGS